MRILYLDIDTTRADHLGCYGYRRNTSPNIDRVAAQGVRFEKCYVSDAPCLPSRAAMFTGQFGIHSGVVGHGGTAADLRIIGRDREFRTGGQRPGFIECLRKRGIYPVSFSPFAERHSAWWFCAGWREQNNSGKGGNELADDVAPAAIEWIGRNAKRDDWLLHVNLWDPHAVYRTPEAYGNPFENEPLDGWYTEEIRRRQWESFGPGTPQEPGGSYARWKGNARQPGVIASMADYKRHIDGYDTGIRYADEWCGRILNALADQGVLDDTIILITSDHGENQGELGVICDHATADHITSRVPAILRWPGLHGHPAHASPATQGRDVHATQGRDALATAGRVDSALHNQVDLAASIVELTGGEVPARWDGRSFAGAFRDGRSEGRPHVVFSQMCWSCQRAVRWDDYVFIRTYHTGLKNFPARMLFDVARDPHEQNNLADSQPALADRGQALLEDWTAEMMSASEHAEDPLWTVMREGGPYHTRSELEFYCNRLRQTGRPQHADFLEKHPTGLAD